MEVGVAKHRSEAHTPAKVGESADEAIAWESLIFGAAGWILGALINKSFPDVAKQWLLSSSFWASSWQSFWSWG